MRESGWGRPSLPSASGTAPAAASAAGPPLDPPAPRSASRGLRVGPCLTDSVEKLITISGTGGQAQGNQPRGAEPCYQISVAARDALAEAAAAQRKRPPRRHRPAVLDQER